MNNLYLAHHGILGMKWGVRRYQNEDGSLTPAGEKRYGSKRESSADYKEYQRLKKKRTYELSNDELRKLNERASLEKERARLQQKGEEYTRRVLTETMGKTLANAATIAGITLAAKFLIKKYNINAETITKYLTNTIGTVTSTAAKETAKGVAKVTNSAGHAYVRAVDNVINSVRKTGRRIKR